MNFKFPSIDLFSFWFGFALATVFWLIILRISRLLPKMRKSMASSRERKSIEKSFTQEHEVLKFMQRKAQASHLASSLFPLDKILVEPKLIAPSLASLTEEELESIPSVYRVLPSMPETPELSADLPALKLDILSVFHAYQYLSISGPEGSGKTTALAFLTHSLINSEPENGSLPFFLDLRQIDQTAESVLNAISTALAQEMRGQSTETLSRIISAAAAQKRLTFLFDGLDEFDQPAFEASIKWLKRVQSEFPTARIIVTNNPYYSGSLESANFTLFTLSAWGQSERQQSLSLWKRALQDYFKTLSQEQKITGVERIERIGLWLSRNDRVLSALNVNLYYWLSYVGALDVSRPLSLYETYINYSLGENQIKSILPALSKCALESGKRTITVEQIKDLLNPVNGSSQETATDTDETDKDAEEDKQNSSSPNHTLEFLLSSTIIKQLAEETFVFSHLALCSKLALEGFSEKPVERLATIIATPVFQESYLLSEPEYLHQVSLMRLFNENDSPLFRNLLFTSNWLKNATTISPMRGEILKRIAAVLQNNQIPLPIRFRSIASLTLAKDPFIAALFNYLKNSPDDSIRQICALGFGILNEEKFVSTLKLMADDTSREVQNIACLSLGRIWTQTAQDALVDVIFSGDEPTRRICCEILALHAPEGHQMLKEITETDNYLAKKAAIYGLLMIKEDWVKPIFEKMSVEDTQWVVRDAAGFALEKFASAYRYLPSPLLPILENPWTLTQADIYGIQLPAAGFPVDLLEKILTQGEDHDRSVALQYLLTQPNANLLNWLFTQIKQPQSVLTEEVVNALYSLGKRGVELSDN